MATLCVQRKVLFTYMYTTAVMIESVYIWPQLSSKDELIILKIVCKE